MVMAPHLDYDDPKYAAGAAEILRRHDNAEAEANITSAVRDFLILTGLAKSDEIRRGKPAVGHFPQRRGPDRAGHLR